MKSHDQAAGRAAPAASDELRARILNLVVRFAEVAHAPKPFIPGETPVPVSGKVYGGEEMAALVDSALDFWLTAGRYNDMFERCLAEFIGVKHVLTSNSGSSSNLIAFSALTSPKLGERALRPGDEVITVAAGFPTTVNPILQHGLVPVFVDIHIPTYNIDPARIEEAVSERTKAIVLAHTLGNPFDLGSVMEIARTHDLWVIEDCCDALGSKYRSKHVGTFGHVGTCSFYPAHHITMGEGGAVFTNDGRLRRIMESIRDWGRDCHCAPGRDNTCRKRFDWKLGELPYGYDHKYVYSHLGFNLKITDMQAAVGHAQLARLPEFIEARKRNFAYLRARLEPLEEYLILPEATEDADPAWFGFPITLRDEVESGRIDLLRYLDQYKIGTRLLFGGNLIRQPYFEGRRYRVAGSLDNTDLVMRRTFWIGVYPGLTTEMLDFVSEKIAAYFGVSLP